MHTIFDDYYSLSLIPTQKSNSIAILCYNLRFIPLFFMPVRKLLVNFAPWNDFYSSQYCCYIVHQQQYSPSSTPSHRPRYTARLCQKRRSPQHPSNSPCAQRISGEALLPLPHYKTKRSRPTASRHLSVHSGTYLSPALSATAETHSQKEKHYITGLIWGQITNPHTPWCTAKSSR